MDRVLLRTGLVLLPLIVGVSRGTAATCAAPGTVTSLEAGRWFSEHNQPACAADAYRTALKADPRSHAALDGLAKSLTATGDTNSAIALLRTAPQDEELTLDLAAAYTKAGRLDEAYQTLTRALKANPASPAG
jgi:tetratricopeptide (TPR) repeat protein